MSFQRDTNGSDSEDDYDCWGDDISTRFDAVSYDWDDNEEPPKSEDPVVDTHFPRPYWVGSSSFVRAMEVQTDIIYRMERTPKSAVKCQCDNFEDSRPALNVKVTVDEECPPTVTFSAEGPPHAPTWKGVAEYKDQTYETRNATTKVAVHKEVAHLIMKHSSQSHIEPVAQELISLFFKATSEARGDVIWWRREGNATILTVKRSFFEWDAVCVDPDSDLAYVQCKHKYNMNFCAYNLLAPGPIIYHLVSKLKLSDWSGRGCYVEGATKQNVLLEDSKVTIALKLVRAYAGLPDPQKVILTTKDTYKRGPDFRKLKECWFHGQHIFLMASSSYALDVLGNLDVHTVESLRSALTRVHGTIYASEVLGQFSQQDYKVPFSYEEPPGYFAFRVKYGPTLRKADVVVPETGFNDDDRCPPLVSVTQTFPKDVVDQSRVLRGLGGSLMMPADRSCNDPKEDAWRRDRAPDLRLQLLLTMSMDAKPWQTNQELIASIRGKGWKGHKKEVNKMLHDRVGVLWKMRVRDRNKEWSTYNKG